MTDANINVKVTSTGATQLTKESAATAANYDQASKSLQTMAASSKRIATPVSNAKKAASLENETYDKLRGTAGASGAEGRDFSNQARGLGGLVHVYATFAANIFAVSAAFTALSRAADTTNMVKGLDQLGASSGRNLGSLSKSLALVSDGAISLRDSMEAVAKASSAGLTNDQIMRLGNVAKSASQALGVAMPDALSRLSRGISKIEPELLDELGIFVRVDKAAQDYARNMGKTVSSLSDFERRQAYAIAVLKEGESKFAAINIEANSYAKLLATLTNVATKFGEAINVAFGPIAKLLSENVLALSTVLGLIVGKLINQAIPALAQWRSNLKTTADEALKTAKAIEQGYGERFVERTMKRAGVPVLKTEQKVLKSQGEAAGKEYAAAFKTAAEGEFLKGTRSKALQGLVAKGAGALPDEKELAALERRVKTMQNSAVESTRMEAAAGEELLNKAKRGLEIREKQLIVSNKLNAAENSAADAANTKVRVFGEEWSRIKKVQYAASRAMSLGILSDVEKAAKEGGVGEGFTKLREEIFGNKTLTGIDKFKTAVKGAFVVATSAVTTFLSAVSPWLAIIGMIVVALQVLHSWASNTAKEAEETSRSIDNLSSSVENLDRTLKNISSKDPLSQLDPVSMAAKMTALNGISEGIVKAIQASQAELDKMNIWDKFIDNILWVFNKDVRSTLNKSLSSSLAESFKALQGSSAETAAKESIKNLLNITGETKEDIAEGIVQAYKVDPTIYDKLVAKQKELATSTEAATTKLKGLTEANAAVTKSVKDYLNSLIPKDNLSQFAQSIIAQSESIREAVKDPLTNITALIDSFKTMAAIQPVDGAGSSIKAISIELEKTAEQYQNVINLNTAYKKELNSLQEQLKKDKRNEAYAADDEDVAAFSSAVKNTQVRIDSITKAIQEGELTAKSLEQKIKSFSNEAVKSAADIFDRGVIILSKTASAEFAKANSSYLSGLASLLGETEAAIKLQLDADKASIAAQMEVIDTQIKLAQQLNQNEISTEKLRLSIEKSILAAEKAVLEESGINTPAVLRKWEGINSQISDIESRSNKLDTQSNAMSAAYSGDKKYLDDLKQAAVISGDRATYELAIKEYLKVQFALAQKAGLDAQLRLKILESAVKLEKVKTEQSIKNNNNAIKSLNIEEQQLSLIKGYNSQAGVSASIRLKEINQAKGILEIQNDILTADIKINAQKIVRDKLVEQGKAKEANLTTQEIARLEIERNRNIELKKAELAQKAISDQIEINTKQATLITTLAEEQYKIEKDILDNRTALNALDSSYLDLLKSANVISEQAYNTEKARLDILKEEISYQTTLSNLTKTKDEEIRKLELRKANAQVELTSPQYNVEPSALSDTQRQNIERIRVELQEVDRLLQNANNSYTTAANRLSIIHDRNKDIVEKTKEVAEYNRIWDETYKNIAASTISLTALFGEMGAKIGLAAEAFAKMLQITEENAKKQESAQQRLNDLKGAAPGESDPKAIAQAEKELADIQKKNAKDNLSLYAAEAGAVKNLFNEKTAAHKVFAATEKALHTARLAMDAAELASAIATSSKQIGAMIQETAASLGLMTAEGGAAVTKQAASGDPYTAFARAAGMAAFVTAIIASFGGKGGGTASVPAATTTAGRQEVQGTGYKYAADGNTKVETGYGILGDPSAKLETIAKSLEIVKDTSIDNSPLFNEMVALLTSIDAGVNQTAKSIFTNSGFRLGKDFQSLNFEKAGTLGSVPVLGKLLGSIFGGSVNQSVEDWGIKFGTVAGLTFSDLVAGKGFDQYVTVKWEKSGGWFSSDKSGINEEIRSLDSTIKGSLTKIFKSAGDLFSQLGEDLGIKATSVLSSLNSTVITDAIYLSIKGLKGEELQEELSATIGGILNQVAATLFPFAERFQQMGEDLTTTLIRIVDTNVKVVHAFKNIGIDFEAGLTDVSQKLVENITEVFISGYEDVITNVLRDTSQGGDNGPNLINEQFITNEPIFDTREVERITYIGKTIKEQSIEITESLVEMAGGLEEFAKGINFYMENFLTEEERKDILSKNVNTEISRISATAEYQKTAERANISTLNSIDSFKQLVKAIDVTTEEGRSLFTSLMNLAPPFHELFAAGQSAEEAASKIEELTATLYRLQGRTDEAIAIERNKALKDLSSEEEKALQQEIWAKQDSLALRKLETSLLVAQGKSFEAMIASREEEVRVLTEAERVIQNQIYAAEDLAKTLSLNTRILQLQGKSQEALTLQRNKELLTLSDIVDVSGKSDRMRQQEIWALEDIAKLKELEIRLLQTQGRAYQALTRTREAEIAAASATERAILNQIYAAEDLNKLNELTVQLLTAQGKTYESLILQRQLEIQSLSDTEKLLKLQIYAYEDLNRVKTLVIELLNAQGKAYESLLLSRELELTALSPLEKEIKVLIYAFEDLTRAQGLTVELLNAQGKAYEAQLVARQLELASLSPLERQIKNIIYAYEDLYKVKALEISLLDIQGKSYESLQLSRQAELASLSPTERSIRQLMYAYEDLQKTIDLNIRLAELQGNTDAVIAVSRDRERKQYSATDRAILENIYALEDSVKIRALETQLLSAQGKTYEALIASRNEELRGLTEAERVIKKEIYAQEDLNKTRSLQISLMQAMGNSQEAVTAQRELEIATLSDLDAEIQNTIYAYEDLMKIKGLEVDLLGAQGKSYEALQITREQEIASLSDSEKLIKQLIFAYEDLEKTIELNIRLAELQGNTDAVIAVAREKERKQYSESDQVILDSIYLMEDAAKVRELETKKLEAQGKAYEALIASRNEELRGLTLAERAIQETIYAYEDLAKTQELQIRLLRASGNESAALVKERQIELNAMSDLDAEIQTAINSYEDYNKIISLQGEVLNAQGKSYEALQFSRNQELATLTDSEKSIKRLIFAFEDLQKTIDLNIRLAELQGNNDAALAVTRTRERNEYSASDQVILNNIYALEDIIKVRTLEIEKLEAQGFSYAALILSRKEELRLLSTTERNIKKQIYAAQDLAKTQNLQISLLRAMGNETAAVALERQIELKGLSATDAAIQSLIWQYEDQKVAADELSSSLENITKSLEDNIRALEEYKASLYIGTQSPLTTADKYNTTKNQIAGLLATIAAPATTDEQLAAQSAAVSELQNVTGTFLDLSRLLYASSAQYTSDFNYVIGALNQASGSLTAQLSDAEKQLNATKEGNASLIDLNNRTAELLSAMPTAVDYGAFITTPINTQLSNVNQNLANTVSAIFNSTNGLIASLNTQIADLVDKVPDIVEYDDFVTTPIVTALENLDYGDLIDAIDSIIAETNAELIALNTTTTSLLNAIPDPVDYEEFTATPIITELGTEFTSLKTLVQNLISTTNGQLVNLNIASSNLITAINNQMTALNTSSINILNRINNMSVTGPGPITTGPGPITTGPGPATGIPAWQAAGYADEATYNYLVAFGYINPNATPAPRYNADEISTGIGIGPGGSPTATTTANTIPAWQAAGFADASSYQYMLDMGYITPSTTFNTTRTNMGIDEPYIASSNVANSSSLSYLDSISTGVVDLSSTLASTVTSFATSIQDTLINQVGNLQLDTRNVETAIYNSSNNNSTFLQAMIDQLVLLNERVISLENATTNIGLLNVEATNNGTTTIETAIINSTDTQVHNTNIQQGAVIA